MDLLEASVGKETLVLMEVVEVEQVEQELMSQYHCHNQQRTLEALEEMVERIPGLMDQQIQ
jgi:hypothetical protein